MIILVITKGITQFKVKTRMTPLKQAPAVIILMEGRALI